MAVKDGFIVGYGVEDWRGLSGQTYECVRCGAQLSGDELMMRGGGPLKCYVCGYHIIKKVRPPVVRRVKAV